MTETVDLRPYLAILRDPVSGGPLELRAGPEAGLFCPASGLFYGFRGPLPDLRPGAGRRLAPAAVEGAKDPTGPLDPATLRTHARVRDHYHDKPCHDYLSLDNLPLGRWLEDPQHEHLFRGVELAVEVGAGKGAIARALRDHRGITPLCIDLAEGSLRHVLEPPLAAPALLGSNLALPLADRVADLVVSYGVIHHTPDPFRALRELARILKPGGRLLLGVYNWENLYRSLYFVLSPPLRGLRHLLGERLGDRVLQLTVFPPYHLALWAVLGAVQHRYAFPALAPSWQQFGDFFLTPIARFYFQGEMVSMGETLGLRLLEHATGGWPGNGFSHFYWFEKT